MIEEYWVMDYAGSGGRQFIGNPKHPTFSIYNWVDGEYEVQRFRMGERILSPLFPDPVLTVDQIFAQNL